MLKRVRILVLILTVAQCVWSSRAEDEKPQTRKLQFESSPAAATTFTPARLSEKVREVRIAGKGKISLAGRQLDLAGVFLGSGCALVLDCDGDGKAAASEHVAVDLRNSASFRLHLPVVEGKARDYAVRFYAVNIQVNNNVATSVSARVVNQSCMSTTFQGVPIRIFDEDLDGSFTQDGKDAIAIGDSGCALPLLTHHRIGHRHYRLNVAADGSSITFEPAGEQAMGILRPPPTLAGAAAIILADVAAGRAYDVAGGAEMPEGLYRLSYAVLHGGGRTVLAVGGERSELLEIKAKNINMPRLGAPLTIDFSARQVQQSIEVAPEIRVWGAGGEEYKFDLAGLRPLGEVRIVFANGRTALASGNLAYIDDRIPQKYADWVPAGMTRQGGRVLLTTAIPLLGEAAGVRTMEEVLVGARTPPDLPKGPSVLHKPISTPDKPAEPKPVGKPEAHGPESVGPRPEKTPPLPTSRPEDSRPGKPLTDKDRAEIVLMAAESLIAGGDKAEGVRRLNDLIKTYPTTYAALRAGDILQRLKEKEEEDRDRQ